MMKNKEKVDQINYILDIYAAGGKMTMTELMELGIELSKNEEKLQEELELLNYDLFKQGKFIPLKQSVFGKFTKRSK